jgi:hypothetical protein
MVSVPTIAGGSANTLAFAVLQQPELTIYDILAVPVDIPVITPVRLSKVTLAMLVLDQVPPARPLANVVDDPKHTPKEPVILGMVLNTFTVVRTLQPTEEVKVTTVVPTLAAVIKPVVVPMYAFVGSLLLHVPGPDKLDNVID